MMALLALLAVAAVRAQEADKGCAHTGKDASFWAEYARSQAKLHPSTDYSKVFTTLESCRSDILLLGHPAVSCLHNLWGHARHVAWAPKSRKMGFAVTDAQYERSLPKEMVALPQEFRNGLPKNWRDIAYQKNWPYLLYSSSTVLNGSFKTPSRLLFFIEGADKDQWVQFTYPDPGFLLHQKMIDTITLDKTSARPKIYFRQYNRNWLGRNPRPRFEKHPHAPMDRCFSCHPNGMRAIVPAPGTLRPVGEVKGDSEEFRKLSPIAKAQERLRQLNRKLEAYAPVDWHGSVMPQHHGPPLGERQGCTGCHNDREDARSAIRSEFLIHPKQLKNKIVGEGSMPPGGGMDEVQRRALYHQIVSDYAEDFKKWLAPAACNVLGRGPASWAPVIP